jgi:hypothetical protein
MDEVGECGARNVAIRDVHDASKIFVFKVICEVSRVLSQEVEWDAEEHVLNLESPQSVCRITYTQPRTLIFTISSRMYSVGCSSRSCPQALAEDMSLVVGISSKDMSEDSETLLIVGVGGSGRRFSMAS